MISAVKPRHGKVTVVPNNSEKYITFTIGDVTFKDSYAFTLSSLDSLVGNLTFDQLKSTRRWLENSVERIKDKDFENSASTSESDEDDEMMDSEDLQFIDDRPTERRRYEDIFMSIILEMKNILGLYNKLFLSI